ncbi:M24 family metallopeptidase [Paenibacillus senegalensis]|uniref:M24 family metallopeptidase n=1 Tax=Paenibacillus senegalensis TaxID=1465766 RepID=UPI000A2F7D13|nr:Xaa-Pro peptidase family protein [Paenibacillus senegalensis]
MERYRIRQQKLRSKLAELGWDGFWVTQNVDMYYLNGSMQTGYLFIPARGEPIFYVRRSVLRAEEESSCSVEELGSLRTLEERLIARYPELYANGRRPVIATEFDVLPVQWFRRLEAALSRFVWEDGSKLIREVRMIKDADELDSIRKAAQVTDAALEHALAQLKLGMTDLELVRLVEMESRRQGHSGQMRMRGYNQEIITGMVGSGSAAAIPTYFDGPAGGQGLGAATPQGAGQKRIQPNEPILVDIGCCIEGYLIDQTRTVVIGELAPHLEQAYRVAEEILRETEARLKPGTICEDLYLLALEMAERAGLRQHFMGFDRDQVSFLGHGVGLEIDELPILARGFRYPLEEGMVIAIEPKFTFPGQGVVGIENTYAITSDGFEKLTRSREGVIRLPCLH